MTVVAARPLRDYQDQAIKATIKAAVPGFAGYYCLPTGTGKTRVITGLVEHFTAAGRVMVVAHREELINQAAASIREDVPEVTVGIEMAGRFAGGARVVVGSIQTLGPSRLASFLTSDAVQLSFDPAMNGHSDVPFSAVIFDECHHATGSNSYSALIGAMKEAYPECRFLGCTATPFRSDKSSMLDTFPVCTFQRAIPQMVDAGWLCPVVWNPVKLSVDTSKLAVGMTSNGRDYTAESVEKLYSPQSEEIARRVKELIERRPTVVFAATVDHAYQLGRAFADVGLSVEVIESAGISRDERKRRLEVWQTGRVQIVVNVGILTEGFDYKPLGPNKEGLAAVVIVRPTMSPSLYLQMIGRGTRLKFGSYRDCLMIDVVGNANLLETKQILLPKVMPTISDEDIDEFEEIDLFAEKKKKRKKRPVSATPFSVHINDDAAHASWLAWGCQEGVYYSEIADKTVAILLPDHEGTGLYYARILTKEQYHTTTHNVVDRAVPLSECMQHLNLIVAKIGNRKLLDKDARWRQEPASEKQLKWLTKKEQEESREYHWTRGEAGLALTWKWNKSSILRVQSELKEGVSLCS